MSAYSHTNVLMPQNTTVHRMLHPSSASALPCIHHEVRTRRKMFKHDIEDLRSLQMVSYSQFSILCCPSMRRTVNLLDFPSEIRLRIRKFIYADKAFFFARDSEDGQLVRAEYDTYFTREDDNAAASSSSQDSDSQPNCPPNVVKRKKESEEKIMESFGQRSDVV